MNGCLKHLQFKEFEPKLKLQLELTLQALLSDSTLTLRQGIHPSPLSRSINTNT